MKVVLASESQSRKRALDILGLTYEDHPSTIDEKSMRDSDAVALTTSPRPRLAKLPPPSVTLSWCQATLS
jgi:predicted house-cleaning NTP pyrophosphatase (Maf/HAM1 superfamily)